MAKPRQLMLKAIVSSAAMQRLYELRQETRGDGGMRSRVAIVVTLALVAIAVTLLTTTAWVPQDIASYLASRSNIVRVEDGDLTWAASEAVYGSCGDDCVSRLRTAGVTTRPLAEIDRFGNHAAQPAVLLVRLAIAPAALAAVRSEQVVVVSLPRFNFYRAELYVDGIHRGRFLRGDRVYVALETAALAPSVPVVLEALMEVLPSERTIAGLRNQEGVLAATQSEFEHYRDFVGAQAMSAVGAIGHLSKIVLALFCLMLFLIVDSSPESYGLALFMGFEAAAMGIDMGWMPLGFVGLGHTKIFTNFFYQMGDILKLYFLFQMARLGGTKATRWLVFGALASLPYGIFMEYASQNSIDWVYKLPRSRDTIVGTLGAFVCLRALWTIRDQRLPWRKAALFIAATAAAFEVVDTWIAHSDLIRVYPQVRTMFTVFQANCGYLFALSTFLNISTLENRVRSLTKAKARADEIERELAVGQLVQQALLKPPQLPDSVDLTCHHEAALYVSGDTYYAHWDEAHGIFTFLVNDVTGHGVQAALKASACNVLAKTVWENRDATHAPSHDGSRLIEYDRVTEKLLVEMNAVPDFNSLIGAEFRPATGELTVYRSNFTFPILIAPLVELTGEVGPVLGEMWRPEVVVSRNREILRRHLGRGSFLLFMSDGFMESSRECKQFTVYLRRQLAQRDSSLSCAAVTDIVLRYEGFKRRKVVDDRTLLVFQWALATASAEAEPEATVPLALQQGAPVV